MDEEDKLNFMNLRAIDRVSIALPMKGKRESQVTICGDTAF